MNIETISVDDGFGNITEHVIIDRGNGEFTSMPKSEYDRQQAEQSTPSVIHEAKTK
jgi:hypothetical protein